MVAIFECDQYDFPSKTKSAIIVHLNSLHKMVKHKCFNCGSQFSSKSNLRKHVESVHERKKYPCDACDHIAKEGNLRIHKLS